jgi:5-oxoprolinase (ATP-hydrolysing) subunit A
VGTGFGTIEDFPFHPIGFDRPIALNSRRRGWTRIMRSVDLNCDCGEGFGAYRMGDDEAMFDIVTSASVACGFHAGDPDIMAETFRLAKVKGVAVGAHPSFPDLQGFGRRRMAYTNSEIERLVAYQIGAAQALAALAGHRLTHVKVHGALSNMAMEDETMARAIARASKAVDPNLIFLAIAGTALERAGEKENLAVAREIFADRAYTDEGFLVSRSIEGAIIHDAEIAAARVLDMVGENAIIAQSGKRIPAGIDSICVHGDTPDAVHMAKTVRQKLEAAGFQVKPFASV